MQSPAARARRTVRFCDGIVRSAYSPTAPPAAGNPARRVALGVGRYTALCFIGRGSSPSHPRARVANNTGVFEASDGN